MCLSYCSPPLHAWLWKVTVDKVYAPHGWLLCVFGKWHVVVVPFWVYLLAVLGVTNLLSASVGIHSHVSVFTCIHTLPDPPQFTVVCITCGPHNSPTHTHTHKHNTSTCTHARTHKDTPCAGAPHSVVLYVYVTWDQPVGGLVVDLERLALNMVKCWDKKAFNSEGSSYFTGHCRFVVFLTFRFRVTGSSVSAPESSYVGIL